MHNLFATNIGQGYPVLHHSELFANPGGSGGGGGGGEEG